MCGGLGGGRLISIAINRTIKNTNEVYITLLCSSKFGQKLRHPPSWAYRVYHPCIYFGYVFRVPNSPSPFHNDLGRQSRCVAVTLDCRYRGCRTHHLRSECRGLRRCNPRSEETNRAQKDSPLSGQPVLALSCSIPLTLFRSLFFLFLFRLIIKDYMRDTLKEV